MIGFRAASHDEFEANLEVKWISIFTGQTRAVRLI